MTLQELWMVIVRRWKLVVALPVALALACGFYLAFAAGGEKSYTAEASVVANSQATGVVSMANAEASKLASDERFADIEVTAKVVASSTTVSVTATGVDADLCIEAANTVAEAANEAAIEAYADFENPYAGSVVLATETEGGESSNGIFKYLVVAVLAGLFIAICIVVVLDMLKRPVKTPEGVQDAVELPVLEILPAKSGERLLANVRFAAASSDSGYASGTAPMSVLVMPAGDVAAAESACQMLESAARSEGANGFKVMCARPLSEGMAGAYSSRDADAVVIAVRQWKDSLPQLESTTAELRLAGAKLAGLVFAKDKLGASGK